MNACEQPNLIYNCDSIAAAALHGMALGSWLIILIAASVVISISNREGLVRLYPTVVAASMEHLSFLDMYQTSIGRLDVLSNRVVGRIAKPKPRNSTELPVPHRLDFDWRFTSGTNMFFKTALHPQLNNFLPTLRRPSPGALLGAIFFVKGRIHQGFRKNESYQNKKADLLDPGGEKEFAETKETKRPHYAKTFLHDTECCMTKVTSNIEANDEAVIQFLDFLAKMIAKRHLLSSTQSDEPQVEPIFGLEIETTDDSERI